MPYYSVNQVLEDGQITETASAATGSVCIDCLMHVANSDQSGIADVDKWAAAVDATDATESGKYRVVVTGDETYFSSSRCDFCSDPVAGDRIDVEFIAS